MGLRGVYLPYLFLSTLVLCIVWPPLAYADGGHRSQVSLLVASPGRSPAQLFGHVLLCFDLRDNDPGAGDCYDYGRVVEQPNAFGVPTTGGRFSSVHESAFRTLVRYRNQGRELTRVDISASHNEIDKLFQAATRELQVNNDYVYDRCKRNCATIVLRLLRSQFGDSWTARFTVNTHPAPFRNALAASFDSDPVIAAFILIWDHALVAIKEECGEETWLLPAQIASSGKGNIAASRWVLFYRVSFTLLIMATILKVRISTSATVLTGVGITVWLVSFFGAPVGVGDSFASLAFLPTDFLLRRLSKVGKIYALIRLCCLYVLLVFLVQGSDPLGFFVGILPAAAASMRYLFLAIQRPHLLEPLVRVGASHTISNQ